MTTKRHLARFILCTVLTSGTWVLAANTGNSKYYFPQMADGHSRSMGIGIGTEFCINNVQSGNTTVTLAFFNDEGKPWTVDLRSDDRLNISGDVSSVTFTMEACETVHLYTGGVVEPLAAGWAVLMTNQPVVTSANYQVIDSITNRVIWEVGVLPAEANTLFSFDANVSQDDRISGIDVDTGYAIANPSGAEATITASLLPRTGAAISTKAITVPPGGHSARFLSELFNDVSWSSRFHGAVRFSSNVNVAVLALKHSWGNGSEIYSTQTVSPDTELRRNVTYDREDNGSFDKAEPIDVPCEVRGTTNSPADGADPDYFAIPGLSAGQVLYVLILTQMVNSPLDAVVTVYDPDRQQIASVNDFAAGLRDAFVQVAISKNGTHYIRTDSMGGTWSRAASYRMLVITK